MSFFLFKLKDFTFFSPERILNSLHVSRIRVTLNEIMNLRKVELLFGFGENNKVSLFGSLFRFHVSLSRLSFVAEKRGQNVLLF